MALVKDYGTSTTDDVNFSVVFSIPNNCDYQVTNPTGKYVVNVYLKKGQTVPSSVFVPVTLSLASIADILNVEFEQVLSGITTNKPKLSVNNC